MQEGARVAGFVVTSRLPSRDGVARWRALAEDTGEPAELLVLESRDAEARRRFVDAHRRLATLTDPALARTRATRIADGRAIAVRDPVEDDGLERVPGPIDPRQVAWIGATLLPAVLEAGDVLHGLLRPEDVALTDRGAPILAPRGAPPDRLPREDTARLAPEATTGAPAAASALYGLGAVLWSLATGRPWQRASPDATPPAPGVLRPGLPALLDEAVLALLSRDPGRRPGALPLLQELSGPPGDLRRLARIHPATVPVRTTRGAVGEPPEPGAMVLVPARALSALSAAERSLLAGLAALPDAWLEELAARGLPIVVEGTAGARAARRRAAEIAAATGLPVVWGSRSALPGWLPLAAGALAAAVAAAVAIALAVAGVVPGLVIALGVSALSLLGGALAGRALGRAHAWQGAGRASARRARALLEDHSARGRLDAAFEALARTRRDVARVALPPAVATDVRAALRDVERRLLALGEATRGADAGVDVGLLRTRLAVLRTRPDGDPEVARERDRLARTLADLEAAEERRERMVAARQPLLDRLDAIGAAVAGLDPDDEAALDRLASLLREGS